MRARWKAGFLVVLLLAAFGLTACSDDDTDDGGASSSESSDDAADAAATVTIENQAFSPDSLTVASGDTIEVNNEDGVRHTFTSDDAGFDTEVPGGDSDTAVVDAEPGTYEFRCTIHSTMKGTITVE
jgi:plastocyanin